MYGIMVNRTVLYQQCECDKV